MGGAPRGPVFNYTLYCQHLSKGYMIISSKWFRNIAVFNLNNKINVPIICIFLVTVVAIMKIHTFSWRLVDMQFTCTAMVTFSAVYKEHKY